MIHIHLLDLFKAEYKKGRGEMNKEPAVLGRPDFEHAKGVSKLLSQVSFSVILQWLHSDISFLVIQENI